MKVVVIGTGRVGLPLSLSLLEAGLDVVGVDLDERIRKAINEERRMPFHEPGFDELVASGKLHIVGDLSEAPDADYYIITVGTPLLSHLETDLSAVTRVIYTLCERLKPGTTVIMRSTTAPRTTQYVADAIELRTGFKAGRDITLAYCPERIVEGAAREELKTLPQVIGANDWPSAERAERLFAHLGVPILHCDYITAELVKLFNNVSRYAYFGVVNGLAMIAMDQGADPIEVLDFANRGYPRPIVGRPGFTAGTCLRKDFGMLAEAYWTGSFLTETWRINESLPRFLVEATERRYGPLKGKKVAVLGYSFKRDTDDVRDSLAPKLVRYLHRAAPESIVVSDPFVSGSDIEKLPNLSFVPEMAGAIANAEFVFLATNHTLYSQQFNTLVARIEEGNARVVDIWNCCGQRKVFLDRTALELDAKPIVLKSAA